MIFNNYNQLYADCFTKCFYFFRFLVAITAGTWLDRVYLPTLIKRATRSSRRLFTVQTFRALLRCRHDVHGLEWLSVCVFVLNACGYYMCSYVRGTIVKGRYKCCKIIIILTKRINACLVTLCCCSSPAGYNIFTYTLRV